MTGLSPGGRRGGRRRGPGGGGRPSPPPRPPAPAPTPPQRAADDPRGPSASSRSRASTLPFSTWRARFFSIPRSPFLARSGVTSTSTTLLPASAATCAMPAPICPAPTTPIVPCVIGSRSPSWPTARALLPSLSGGCEHEARLVRGGGRERDANSHERRDTPDERACDRHERCEAEEQEAARERRRVAEEEIASHGAARRAAAQDDEKHRETEDLRGGERSEQRDA